MHKVILADDREIFRIGTAKVLAMEDDLRIIARCPDCLRLNRAIATFRGAVVLVAVSMRADLVQIANVARSVSSRLILIAENGEPPPKDILGDLQGLVYRNVSSAALVDCVRKVIRGDRAIHPVQSKNDAESADLVGARVRDRLTPKEMKIAALIGQGCKNREIAFRLGTTGQVVKNYLRSIYDKTGVSDRLELALFTFHHPTLAAAAAAVGERMVQ